MTLYEHYQIERAEGREEGVREGLNIAVDNIIKAGASVEKACAIVGISVNDYEDSRKN